MLAWWNNDTFKTQTFSRSVLRDSQKRVQKILIKCGVPEDENQELITISSGNPFNDMVRSFLSEGNILKELIIVRNENQRKTHNAADMARDSQDINNLFTSMKEKKENIKEYISNANNKLAKYNKNKKDPEKIQKLENEISQYNTTYTNCENLFETLHNLNSQRFGNETKTEPKIKHNLRKSIKDIHKMKQNNDVPIP